MLFGNEKEQNHQYTHSLFADKAINFIDRNHQTPFSSTCRFVFLTADTSSRQWYLHTQKGWTKLQKICGYDHCLDETVGRIVSRLEALGIDDNTYIFFTSDNGPAKIFGDWEKFNSNGVFRGDETRSL